MRMCEFWGSATIDTKGQFVIPAAAREQIGFREGDKVIIVSTPNDEGVFAIKPEALEKFIQQITLDMQTVLKEAEKHKEVEDV